MGGSGLASIAGFRCACSLEVPYRLCHHYYVIVDISPAMHLQYTPLLLKGTYLELYLLIYL